MDVYDLLNDGFDLGLEFILSFLKIILNELKNILDTPSIPPEILEVRLDRIRKLASYGWTYNNSLLIDYFKEDFPITQAEIDVSF